MKVIQHKFKLLVDFLEDFQGSLQITINLKLEAGLNETIGDALHMLQPGLRRRAP